MVAHVTPNSRNGRRRRRWWHRTRHDHSLGLWRRRRKLVHRRGAKGDVLRRIGQRLLGLLVVGRGVQHLGRDLVELVGGEDAEAASLRRPEAADRRHGRARVRVGDQVWWLRAYRVSARVQVAVPVVLASSAPHQDAAAVAAAAGLVAVQGVGAHLPFFAIGFVLVLLRDGLVHDAAALGGEV